MKTTYSRRELYAFGEPIGESATHEIAGRRIYGGGGGIVGDIVGGVSDAVSGAVDAVGDAGAGIDRAVRDTVPGGWKLPAAAAAAYYGMPGGLESSGGAVGMGDAAAWDAATADMAIGGLDPYEIYGSGASQWGGAGDYMDLGALSGTDLGGAGGSPASWLNGAGLTGAAAAKALGNSGLSLGGAALGAAGLAGLMNMLKSDSSRYGVPGRQDNVGPMGQFKYNPALFSATRPDPAMFRPRGAPTAKIGYAGGGSVEQMSNANALGQNTGFPMADMHSPAYATPYQTPVSQNVVTGVSDVSVDPYTGEQRFASGGLSSLGGYSDGGRLLKGPGDGMSDNIPAKIGRKQPARLADGEFVVPADVVSHLGNGSTDAGAKQLYKMMDRIRSARTGRKAQGKQIKADKFLPK